MPHMGWTLRDVPDLTGRTIVVTGANSGLGLEGARAFAGRGAHVVLACRSADRAEAARGGIAASHPQASLEVMPLDLANLSSVRVFGAAFASQHDRLDVLCNNAGVMALPRRETADGFEMQIGTNHLGHFALTALLLPLLLRTPGSRVVTQSSGMHRIGRINFDDLHGSTRYGRWSAYGQSKLANLLFAYELQRRLVSMGARTISVACHPGYSATELQFAGARMERSALMERVFALGNRLLAQDAASGALPMLYAATAPDVRGGEYFGPEGLGEMWGSPKRVVSNARSRDAAVASRLWAASEDLTGVRYQAFTARAV
jgi:NAD(P)-dependent dehydrogenase (short-subunit alcohol dehydrogenase family)